MTGPPAEAELGRTIRPVNSLVQQSHMFGISTVLGGDSLPELSTAMIVNVFVPFRVAYTIVEV